MITQREIKFPKIPEHFKIKVMWTNGGDIMAMAECKEEDQVRLFIWDGIAENYNQHYTFQRYTSKEGVKK